MNNTLAVVFNQANSPQVVMTSYAMFFQLGERAARIDQTPRAFENRLRLAYLSGFITEDQEEAFWDGFYSVERREIFYM